MADAPLTLEQLDVIEQREKASRFETEDGTEVYPGVMLSNKTCIALLALARQGVAAQALAEAGPACLTGVVEGKPCRPDAINLRLCTICGFTVDLSYEAQKPSIEFGMAGRGNTRIATSAPEPEPEYTREEMREACRINYNAGAGADLAAKVAQLRADVAAMGNALADHFNNGIDYSTGANLRAIAERQGGL